MNELIIVTDAEDIPRVSARELHKALEATERFQNWFNRQIGYGFDEGTDFLGCKEFNAQAKQELQDYQITVDMAKQICMLSRSEKGKKYRQYFIDLEKAWNSPEQVMARALKLSEKKNAELMQTIEENRPKVEFAELVEETTDEVAVGDFAKMVSQNGTKINRNQMFAVLRKKGYLSKDNRPKQRFIDSGLFTLRFTTISHADGTKTAFITPRITGKGVVVLLPKFSKQEARAG